MTDNHDDHGWSLSGSGAALVSALLFGVTTPLAKQLLTGANPLLIAGLLYAGSGLGLTLTWQLWKRWRGRELGFSLEEIRTLLRLSEPKDMSCEEVDRLARQQLVEVQLRISELQGMARELKRTIESCVGQSCGECAILGALQRPETSQSQAT
jgi:hypothetical protein